MSKKMTAVVLALIVASPAFAELKCANPNDHDVCDIYRSPVHALNTVGNYTGIEMKFICLTGPRAGGGWHIWCRNDRKCNVTEQLVGTGGSQWTAGDHCTKAGYALPNWDWKHDPTSGYQEEKKAKSIKKAAHQ